MNNEVVRLTFIGDIACDRNLLKAGYRNGSYDYTPVFAEVKDIFARADYVIANFETVCAGSKNNYQEQYMTCNAPDELIEAMSEAGVDMVTTANNHCLDQGIDGLKRTIQCLQKNGIEYIGTNFSKELQQRVLIREFSGVKIAFLSYTYSTNETNTGIILDKTTDFYVNLLREQGKKDDEEISGIRRVKRIVTSVISDKQKRMISRVIARTKLKLGIPYMKPRTDKILDKDTENPYLDLVKKDIVFAKKNADYVIACPHFGGQFNIMPGEYSDFLIGFFRDNGCDSVIGNHPHIVQKEEHEDGKIFAYSIGSFNQSISSDYMVHETKPEYSVMVHMEFNKMKKRINKISFSILKIVEDTTGMITVYPVSELYQLIGCDDRAKLKEDVNEIYKRFTQEDKEISIQEEYLIYERK